MWSFLLSCPDVAHCPAHISQEVAFIGRSNVGKSSLINALTQVRGLAKVSRTPGRTHLINYFQDDKWVFVDLPGYGYARLSQSHKAQISTMVQGYLSARPALHVLVVLIDAVVGVTPLDAAFLASLRTAPFAVIIVVTKRDKATQQMLARAQKQVAAWAWPVVLVSSKTGVGLAALRQLLSASLRRPPEFVLQ